MDIVDYELERSGKYLPATVAAVYSFIDKLISSLAPMLATLLIGIVGYTGSKIPQAGDELTWAIRIITAILYCGLPIIGWLLTEWAMVKFSLTKERMEEIQKNIATQKTLEIEKDNGEVLSAEKPVDEADQSLDAIEEPSQEEDNNDSSK